MHEKPSMYGIRTCNRPWDVLWSREMFPKAFSVALLNYLRDTGISVNLVSFDGSRCKVTGMSVDELYGGTEHSNADLGFDFDALCPDFMDLAHDAPPSDLVIRDGSGKCLGAYDMAVSVVPDSSTRGMPPGQMGPEVTVRSKTLMNCALSIANSIRSESDSVLDILVDVRTESWDEVSDDLEPLMLSLDRLERTFADRQRPFMIQSIWRSETEGPFMAEDAMDVFVWTDLALTRLFLDSDRRSRDGSPTRPVRCAVRLYEILRGAASGEVLELKNLFERTSYDIPGMREFMVNGRTSVRYMGCPRLASPAVGSSVIPDLASQGFESMLEPERRFDISVYYAVRAMRG